MSTVFENSYLRESFMAKNGELILVPTPIAELGGHRSDLREILLHAWQSRAAIVVEDEKPARRRWRSWDLPREAIDDFILYNEHARSENLPKLLNILKEGRDIYLQSDGGMPGFCDPGRDLIYEAQSRGYKVSTTPFYNSLIPAVAMSGFTEGAFEFLSFPPREKQERSQFFQSLAQMTRNNKALAFMDTPYRLERVCQELLEVQWKKGRSQLIYLAMDINRDNFESFWGNLDQLQSFLHKAPPGKREFVCVID